MVCWRFAGEVSSPAHLVGREVVTPEEHRKWQVEQDNERFEHLLVSIHQSINYRPQFRLSDKYE